MRFELVRRSRRRPDELRAALTDTRSWPRWFSAIRFVEERHEEVVLDLGGPRPLVLCLAVRRGEDGLSLNLVEGDAEELQASLVITPIEDPEARSVEHDGSRAIVTLTLDVSFGIVLPGTLRAELHEALNRWMEGLVAELPATRAASEVSEPPTVLGSSINPERPAL